MTFRSSWPLFRVVWSGIPPVRLTGPAAPQVNPDQFGRECPAAPNQFRTSGRTHRPSKERHGRTPAKRGVVKHFRSAPATGYIINWRAKAIRRCNSRYSGVIAQTGRHQAVRIPGIRTSCVQHPGINGNGARNSYESRSGSASGDDWLSAEPSLTSASGPPSTASSRSPSRSSSTSSVSASSPSPSTSSSSL